MSNSSTPLRRTREEAFTPSPQQNKRQEMASDINYRPPFLEDIDSNIKLQDVKLPDTTPEWAKQMFGVIFNTNVHMFNLATSQKTIENSLPDTAKVNKEVADLKIQLELYRREIVDLRQKVTDLENYSKKYNLKVFNIPESHGETPFVLLEKLRQAFRPMGIDLKDMLIDNIHRLPNKRDDGPRPVIIKFVRYLDREVVWSLRNRLSPLGGRYAVTISQHFARARESCSL